MCQCVCAQFLYYPGPLGILTLEMEASGLQFGVWKAGGGQGSARARVKVGRAPHNRAPPCPVPFTGFAGKSHPRPILAGPGPSCGLISSPKPFLPAPLCAQSSMCLLRPFAHPSHLTPSNKVSDKSEAESIVYYCGAPDTSPHSLHLPAFPASSSSRCLSTRGLSAAAPGADVQPSQTLAAAELVWHFSGWPEPAGQRHGGSGGL